jgi:hypothetical protein
MDMQKMLELMKKGSGFQRTPQCKVAFDTLK